MENEGSEPARPITDVELETIRNLEPQLKDHLQANSDVYSFIGLVLSSHWILTLPTYLKPEKNHLSSCPNSQRPPMHRSCFCTWLRGSGLRACRLRL
jgi:hypothetical protein